LIAVDGVADNSLRLRITNQTVAAQAKTKPEIKSNRNKYVPPSGAGGAAHTWLQARSAGTPKSKLPLHLYPTLNFGLAQRSVRQDSSLPEHRLNKELLKEKRIKTQSA
jgi:hypothetical protein